MWCLNQRIFFVPPIVSHPIFEVNVIAKMSKVQPESWHVIVAKFHDLPTWPAINRTSFILGVMIVNNEEIVFWLKGALAHQY
jgi:hypothetical protein